MNVAMWVVFPLAAVLSVLGGLSTAPVAVSPVDEMAWHVDENPPNAPAYQIVVSRPRVLTGPWAETFEDLQGFQPEFNGEAVIANSTPTPLAVMPKLTAAVDSAAVRAAASPAGWPTELHDELVAVTWCESRHDPAATNGVMLGALQISDYDPVSGWPGWWAYYGYDPARYADLTYNLSLGWRVYNYDIERGQQPWSQWQCKPG